MEATGNAHSARESACNRSVQLLSPGVCFPGPFATVTWMGQTSSTGGDMQGLLEGTPGLHPGSEEKKPSFGRSSAVLCPQARKAGTQGTGICQLPLPKQAP